MDFTKNTHTPPPPALDSKMGVMEITPLIPKFLAKALPKATLLTHLPKGS